MIAPQLFDDPTPGEATRHDIRARRLLAVAAQVADAIGADEAVTRPALSALMNDAFGGSDASGAWTMRDAYDACEAAQVVLIQRAPSASERFTGETLATCVERALAWLALADPNRALGGPDRPSAVLHPVADLPAGGSAGRADGRRAGA